MPTPEPVRRYLALSLAGTPEVLHAIVGFIPADSTFWDYRPDPARFTPREVLAHLADWNPIWLERLNRMLAEDCPNMPDLDEGELAREHGYSVQEAMANLLRLQKTREPLAEAVAALPAEVWERKGLRDKLGEHTIADLVTLIVVHDGYHTRQLAEYLKTWHKS